MSFRPIPAETEVAAREVIGAAIEVHRSLGPGFLERIYQEALCLELKARGLPFEAERSVCVHYRGVPIGRQRIDLVVAERVIVELKATTSVDPSAEARIISYLRATELRLGLLLNFNYATLKEGLKRIVL